MTISEAVKIDQLERELKARQEILDALAAEGGSWMGHLDWRLRLRSFAEDSEQHQFDKQAWHDGDDNICLRLFSHADYYAAYFDDAAKLWEQSDDYLPMFHVMVRSDPPHRTCIHAIHLHPWLSHLAEACIPVRVDSLAMLRECS